MGVHALGTRLPVRLLLLAGSVVAGPDWNEIGALGQWASAVSTMAVVIAGAALSRWIVLRSRPRLRCDEECSAYEVATNPEADELWLHLRLKTLSRLQPARHVEAHLIHSYDLTNRRRLPFGSLNFNWTGMTRLALDLPPAFVRRVDIACKVTPRDRPAFVFLPLLTEPVANADWKETMSRMQAEYRLGPGQYRLTIGITASNADAIYFEIVLAFDGITLRDHVRSISLGEVEAHGRARAAEQR